MKVVHGLSWNHPRGHDPLVAAGRIWSERHPGLRVEWSPRSLADFAGGDLAEHVGRADLVTVDHPLIGEAAHADRLEPLDDVLPAAALADITTGSVDAFARPYVRDGRTWAAPLDAAALTAAHRPDLAARHGVRLPTTVDELVETARATGRVAVPLSVHGIVALFSSLCAQAGDEPFLHATVVDHGVGATVLRIMHDLAAAVPSYCHGAGAVVLLDRLAGTEDLVYVGYAYGYSTYSRPGAGSGRQLRFTGVPPLHAGEVPRPTLGGVGIALMRDAPHRTEAVEFLRWVVSDSCQGGPFLAAGGQPARAGVWRDAAADRSTGGFFSATLPSLERAFVRPTAAWFARAQPLLGERLHAFLRGPGDDGELRRTLADLDEVVTAARQGP